MSEDREDIYRVIVNNEEQYSIWPADREVPAGWNDAGKSGPKEEVLEYIKQIWHDSAPDHIRRLREEKERERDK